MFVPANRANMIERAHTTAADVIVLDLEDSVPPAEKETARSMAHDAIVSLSAAGKSVHVRINHHDSGLTRDDLLAVVQPGLDGLAFPKTESARDIRQLDILIRERELKGGVKPGTVALFAHIESARGVLNAAAIIEASTRIAGMALGAYDYALDLGVQRTKAGYELEYARGVIVTTATAYGIQPLDGPFGDFQDSAGLLAESQYVRSIGFKGKYVIHPDQVETVNKVFSPSDEEIELAKRIVAAFDEALANGSASVQLDGRMIDTPIARRAKELLDEAEAVNRPASAS
jgi:citrate lyase subunit beta/citryl-CoA lyase